MHKSVLLQEVIDGLNVKPDGVYVDLTYGRGGHSDVLLKRLDAEGKGRLIVMDKDSEAIEHAKKKLGHLKQVSVVHSDFSQVSQQLQHLGVEHADGILMDLGVSSPQLDNPERGFSFRRSGPLDMRMDTQRGRTAAEWLAVVSEEELANVIWTLGEERYARRIAKAIVQYRHEHKLEQTGQLAAIVRQAVPKKTPGKDDSTRTFQAIRLFINNELESLKVALSQAVSLLGVQGRLAVISFHSLEDRIVKRFFRERIKGETLPPEIPVQSSMYCSELRSIGKAVKPSIKELNENPRSRSAVLRVVERI